jgi:membrane protein DedA with SNARE-associated domain
VTDFILNLIVQGGYAGIFFLMVLENVFPPIPSEVIMGLGGIAVARGELSFGPLIAWGTLGTTLGNYFWYWIGWRTGYRRFQPFVEKHGRWLTLDWHEVEKLHRFFMRHGHWVIFAFRFMPTGRTIISLPAGMACMPHLKFFAWTFVGSAIWNSVLAGAGLFLGRNFEQLQDYVGPFAAATMAVMILWYIHRVITWRPRG